MEQRDLPEFAGDTSNPVHQPALQKQLCRQYGLQHEIPFTGADLTAGTENELAATVIGPGSRIDLPRQLLNDPHTENLSPLARRELEQWLGQKGEQSWDHSWLRLATAHLHPATRTQVARDLEHRADRADFDSGESLRLPASYVLRLALTDACARLDLPDPLRVVAARVAESFLNDNTAPEIISTHIVSGAGGHIGRNVGDENAQRFLLTQLLAAYANHQFGLRETGQRLQVYGAPNPPQRLKQLSRLLPADQYRTLVMNPCLSGFRDGESKRRYMHLCHETLSRSRQHAQARLIGAGIGRMSVIERLVCDTSLLNNGTHLSLGSRALGAAFAAPGGVQAEKYLGDIAAKIIEHFLPLFVGLYSAAPARVAPADFRPEKALGFLPNELSAPFLRLTWSSWKRKAGLFAALKGDFVPDARLLDYFAALPALPGRASLDGEPGNGERLKAALAAQGLYHADMTVYALYRLRELAKMGFSGFEGRHYSLFASFADDLAPAAELQALVTAFAYQQVMNGESTHAQIPDDPETESERRQLFFASAIGLPVAYVRRDTRNHFLLRVLRYTRRTRISKRHGKYFKVYLDDYREALVRMLEQEGPALLDGVRRNALRDLRARLAEPEARGAAGVMTRGILSTLGAKSAVEAEAGAFNAAAERYYRDDLRLRQLAEGIDAQRRQLAASAAQRDPAMRTTLGRLSGGRSLDQFFAMTNRTIRDESADADTLRAWIGLMLVPIAAAQAE